MKKVLLFSSVIIILGLTGCSNKYFNDWFIKVVSEPGKGSEFSIMLPTK